MTDKYKQQTEDEKAYDDVPRGKLGDGGPSSDATGKNRGNMGEEKEEHPSQNATAAGPDGHTPANEPGMSHN